MQSGLGADNVLWEQHVLLQHLCQQINLQLLLFVDRHQSIHLCLERRGVAVYVLQLLDSCLADTHHDWEVINHLQR